VKVSQTDGNWTAEEVWRSRRLKGGYASPIAHDGYLYGIDESILVCLDLADGKLKWKNRDGQYGHGQILLRDDLLVILGEAGELALVEASPEKFRELSRIQAIEGKTWNVPVLVGNRIYVRNHLEMAAYELAEE
jgi:outer membrane protein assembly factor BamB